MTITRPRHVTGSMRCGEEAAGPEAVVPPVSQHRPAGPVRALLSVGHFSDTKKKETLTHPNMTFDHPLPFL